MISLESITPYTFFQLDQIIPVYNAYNSFKESYLKEIQYFSQLNEYSEFQKEYTKKPELLTKHLEEMDSALLKVFFKKNEHVHAFFIDMEKEKQAVKDFYSKGSWNAYVINRIYYLNDLMESNKTYISSEDLTFLPQTKNLHMFFTFLEKMDSILKKYFDNEEYKNDKLILWLNLYINKILKAEIKIPEDVKDDDKLKVVNILITAINKEVFNENILKSFDKVEFVKEYFDIIKYIVMYKFEHYLKFHKEGWNDSQIFMTEGKVGDVVTDMTNEYKKNGYDIKITSEKLDKSLTWDKLARIHDFAINEFGEYRIIDDDIFKLMDKILQKYSIMGKIYYALEYSFFNDFVEKWETYLENNLFYEIIDYINENKIDKERLSSIVNGQPNT